MNKGLIDLDNLTEPDELKLRTFKACMNSFGQVLAGLQKAY